MIGSKNAGHVKTKFSKSQIVAILQEGEAGLPVAQIIRKYGISQATYLS